MILHVFFYKKGMLGCDFSKFSTYFDEKMFKIIKLDIYSLIGKNKMRDVNRFYIFDSLVDFLLELSPIDRSFKCLLWNENKQDMKKVHT